MNSSSDFGGSAVIMVCYTWEGRWIEPGRETLEWPSPPSPPFIMAAVHYQALHYPASSLADGWLIDVPMWMKEGWGWWRGEVKWDEGDETVKYGAADRELWCCLIPSAIMQHYFIQTRFQVCWIAKAMLKFSLKRFGSNINHMYICFIPHTRWILDQVYSVTYSTHPRVQNYSQPEKTSSGFGLLFDWLKKCVCWIG